MPGSNPCPLCSAVVVHLLGRGIGIALLTEEVANAMRSTQPEAIRISVNTGKRTLALLYPSSDALYDQFSNEQTIGGRKAFLSFYRGIP